MNTKLTTTIPAALFLLSLAAAQPAAAQVPFFGGGATIFDPEIGVVQSGVVNDVQATVSADRKYVTMTMRATSAQLLSLSEFAFQQGNAPAGAGGFVGGAGAAGNGAGGNGAAAGGRGNAAAGAAGRAGVLDRPGMTMLGRATRVSPRAESR
jgi:hypothetical protein